MANEADTCRKSVVPLLLQAGWDNEPHSIAEQRTVTDGRIIPVGKGFVRKPPKRVDYLLRYARDFPLAVVEAKASYKIPADAVQQARTYAEMLGLKFAYATNGSDIIEIDYFAGTEKRVTAYPSPAALWQRYQAGIGIVEPTRTAQLLTPYNHTLGKGERYYQQSAINKTVEAILKGDKRRFLITMATGTGKTFVSFQICWKLWSSRWNRSGEHRRPRILYLADRNILVDQPKDGLFAAFGDARHKIESGEVIHSREMYFAIYQALAESENRAGLFRDYPPEFFDLVIVDECHRGSARDDSSWRAILDHFKPAYQLGMTATPMREDNRDTYNYFGNPIYEYSLRQGIDDGFLAPYRVHRVITQWDAAGWRPSSDELDRYGRAIPDDEYQTKDFERVIALRARTLAIARHLTDFLKKTDRFAKTIIFCVDQEHAAEMREALVNLNADLMAQHPDYVARVTADEGQIGRGHLSRFQDVETKTPTILTTSQLLTTGVDAPTCKNVVLARVVGSMSEFKQIIGRGTANSAFQSLSSDVTPRLSVIETEQDARLQLIDRFLVEVLGWDHAAITTEPHSPLGYTDYLLKIAAQARFVLEAKRTGKALLDTLNPSYRTYKVSSPALASASDGIKQAAGYCLDHGVDFAVVTTGLVWIAFLPFPAGKSYREGTALAFPSLAAINDNFAAFYDLFSKEGISKKLYKLHFAKADGLAIQQYDPLISVNKQSDLRLLSKSSLAADLDPVFREFFGSLSGDSDKDMLLECFVETPESRHADAALEKLLRTISSGVSTIETGTGSQIAREIENAVTTMRGDTIVIVGNKGAGKSTFVERFFELVLDRSIRGQCLVINIDLLKSNGDISSLPAWIAEKVRAALEVALFANAIPTYDQLKGIYHSEYTKWRDGQFAPLYKSNKDSFEVKFGDFLDGKINSDDYAYVLRLLDHVVKSRRLLPCIILDNADHYPEAFQEAAFQWTQSIRTEIPFSFVVVPVTDRTIWRLSKAGPFQTYRSKLFYLPVPSTKDVLGKRISYLKSQANKSRNARSYFLQKGIRLSVDNIQAFAACSEEIFLNEPFISRRIGWLSNHDIRRSLLISQQVLTSPHLSIDDLVGSYLKGMASGQVKISYRKFMQALIQGDYNAFQQDNSSFVLNIFEVSPDFPSTPLLRLSILKLLIDRAGEESGVGSYIPIAQIYSYCDAMGIGDDAVRAALNILMSYRLVEPYDASAQTADDAQQLVITHSGRMHYEMATTDLLYVSQMAFSTPLRALSVADKLTAIKSGYMGNKEWVEIRRIFLVYCIAQDRSLARVPNDKIFEGQRQLRQDLQQRWVLNRNPSAALTDEEIPPEISAPERTGKDEVVATVKWFDDKKGFGFLAHTELGDIFVHKRALRAKGIETLGAGDTLTCDVGPGEKGRFQVIHLHTVSPAAVSKLANDQEWRVGTIDFFNSGRGFGFVKVVGLPDDAFLPGRVVESSNASTLVSGQNVEVRIDRDSRGTGFAVTQIRVP